MLRKYDGPVPDPSTEALEFSEDEVVHQAGSVSHRPLTRSSVKPRLLFQEEIKERERAALPEYDEEEATTDYEAPIATPSRKKHGVMPSLESARPATPPPTVRTTRRKLSPFESDVAHVNDRSEISFNSWTRVKSANHESSSSRGKKRGGDSLESNTQKRPRSDASAMSLDDAAN